MSNDLENPGRKIPKNEVLENIYSRRSVKDYLSDDVIRELIRTATYAPSAANVQPWRFVVIKNRELIAELSGKAKELWIEQAAKSTRQELKSLAMIFSDSDAFSPEIDCAIAGENMMLAAKSLGIGSCWIGLV